MHVTDEVGCTPSPHEGSLRGLDTVLPEAAELDSECCDRNRRGRWQVHCRVAGAHPGLPHNQSLTQGRVTPGSISGEWKLRQG